MRNRHVCTVLATGEKVVVYVRDGRIALQVRRLVHGSEDPFAASFKSAVTLTPADAARVAAELLTSASLVARPCPPPVPA